MTSTDQLLHTLRTWHRMPAGRLTELLQVSRATLMRAVRSAGSGIVARGNARRTTYAARRLLRGSPQPLTLFQVDEHGGASEVGQLHLTYPAGCALDFLAPLDWPLEGDMRDGWFDGLPYPLEDMRPQGYLGRQFAREHAALLQVPDDPRNWSDDDALYALSLLGVDQSSNYILGEPAYRRWLEEIQQPAVAVLDSEVEQVYPALAQQSMTQGHAGSSAGGEFPKFTTVRRLDGAAAHVIVKFSGSDESPGTQRWSDLLVCEHLAATIVAARLQMTAAKSRIYRAGGRTFLEVVRFDRHGQHGRSGVCSWASLNNAMFGMTGRPWAEAGAKLFERGLLSSGDRDAVARLEHFGHLIGNTDMHDGNLSFLPGLRLAPAYDMLPMLYAPQRGVELPDRQLAPRLPLPGEHDVWQVAARAATEFWGRAAADERISQSFRRICEHNARVVTHLANAAAARGATRSQ